MFLKHYHLLSVETSSALVLIPKLDLVSFLQRVEIAIALPPVIVSTSMLITARDGFKQPSRMKRWSFNEIIFHDSFWAPGKSYMCNKVRSWISWRYCWLGSTGYVVFLVWVFMIKGCLFSIMTNVICLFEVWSRRLSMSVYMMCVSTTLINFSIFLSESACRLTVEKIL